jgi:hypothetical protein
MEGRVNERTIELQRRTVQPGAAQIACDVAATSNLDKLSFQL